MTYFCLLLMFYKPTKSTIQQMFNIFQKCFSPKVYPVFWLLFGRMYFLYYSIPFTADFPNLFLVFFDSIFRDFQYFFQFFKAFFRIFFCTIVPKTHNCRSRTQILANKLAHKTHNWIRHFCPYILFYLERTWPNWKKSCC